MNHLFQLPTRLDCIENALTREQDIRLFLKRDDLIHAEISGNKWRKLKYNIEAAKQRQKKTLLTFGGAFSNHITATAAAGKYLGFKTVGIIRGEEHLPLNASLQFAVDAGMQLHYLDRTSFRNIRTSDETFNPSDWNIHLEMDEKDIYVIPEGGANTLALQGCREIVDEIIFDFDYICCASGTGTTIAGIADNLKEHQQAIGFAVLKHDNFLQEIHDKFPNTSICLSIQNAHFGGYAKTTPELLRFIYNFQEEHRIALDYVYTGKLMYHLFELIAQGFFPEKSTIIAVHTGGVANASV